MVSTQVYLCYDLISVDNCKIDMCERNHPAYMNLMDDIISSLEDSSTSQHQASTCISKISQTATASRCTRSACDEIDALLSQLNEGATECPENVHMKERLLIESKQETKNDEVRFFVCLVIITLFVSIFNLRK